MCKSNFQNMADVTGSYTQKLTKRGCDSISISSQYHDFVAYIYKLITDTFVQTYSCRDIIYCICVLTFGQEEVPSVRSC